LHPTGLKPRRPKREKLSAAGREVGVFALQDSAADAERSPVHSYELVRVGNSVRAYFIVCCELTNSATQADVKTAAAVARVFYCDNFMTFSDFSAADVAYCVVLAVFVECKRERVFFHPPHLLPLFFLSSPAQPGAPGGLVFHVL